MFEAGEKVRFTLEGRLEHVVASPNGLRASVMFGNTIALTVPYASLSRTEDAQ